MVVVAVEGWSPRTTFEEQLRYWATINRPGSPRSHPRDKDLEARWKAEAKELRDWVWWMLKSGAEPSEVQAILASEQTWPFMTVTTDRESLERELETRYKTVWVELKYGGELDIEPDPIPIPGGMALEGAFWTR